MRWPRIPRLRLKAGAMASAFGLGSGWHSLFRERETGSWQRDIRVSPDELRQHPAVFACMSLIGNDISKCRPRLMGLTADSIWLETANPAYSPVINKPNSYQNPLQFLETWVWSKLGHGNFYGLKMRDARGVVTAIYPLDPFRVRPLITTDGTAQVFYELSNDNMVPGLEATVTVPAREIVHDRWYTMHHPLVGMSPLYAAHLPAAQGLTIQKNATRFFRNGAQPSGVLTAPGAIDPDTAKRLEDKWENDFQGENVGKIAVLGSGLKFETMSMSAEASQVVSQLKYGGEQVCSVFHVPPYKIGLGNIPAGLNIQALNVEYLSQALQRLIEDIERCWSDGLATGTAVCVRLDLDKLLRMDSVSLMTTLKEGVTGGIYAPNEARRKIDLPPVKGGETPYLQQQNFSLEALAKRDASDDPFESMRVTETGPIPGDAAPKPPAAAAEPPPNAEEDKPAVENEFSDMEMAIIELSMRQTFGIVPSGESLGITQ